MQFFKLLAVIFILNFTACQTSSETTTETSTQEPSLEQPSETTTETSTQEPNLEQPSDSSKTLSSSESFFDSIQSYNLNFSIEDNNSVLFNNELFQVVKIENIETNSSHNNTTKIDLNSNNSDYNNLISQKFENREHLILTDANSTNWLLSKRNYIDPEDLLLGEDSIRPVIKSNFTYLENENYNYPNNDIFIRLTGYVKYKEQVYLRADLYNQLYRGLGFGMPFYFFSDLFTSEDDEQKLINGVYYGNSEKYFEKGQVIFSGIPAVWIPKEQFLKKIPKVSKTSIRPIIKKSEVEFENGFYIYQNEQYEEITKTVSPKTLFLSEYTTEYNQTYVNCYNNDSEHFNKNQIIIEDTSGIWEKVNSQTEEIEFDETQLMDSDFEFKKYIENSNSFDSELVFKPEQDSKEIIILNQMENEGYINVDGEYFRILTTTISFSEIDDEVEDIATEYDSILENNPEKVSSKISIFVFREYISLFGLKVLDEEKIEQIKQHENL
jgi:hypothetical protein